jgi:hypothetical protein
MTNRCLIFVLVGFFYSSTLYGQVKNNSIRGRLKLDLDRGAVKSTTAGSSVEWDCVNKALTRKCIVYHNDQWFEFSVPVPGQYFINISAQQCSDNLGVQAIVIEGNPCEIATYRILRCINRIRREDAYIQMDSLRPGVPYLVNIDGFLGDACDFNIELSSKAQGFPYQDNVSDTTLAPVVQKQHRFRLFWTGDERMSAWQSFRVYRWFGAGQPSLILEQAVVRNAYGRPELNYQATDSLIREGLYTYKIYAVKREDLTLVPLVTQQVTFVTPPPPRKIPDPERSVRVTLPFKSKISVDVIVYDLKSDVKKRSTRILFDPAWTNQLEIPLGDLIDQGIVKFLVLVANTESKEALEFYYSYAYGRFVKE